MKTLLTVAGALSAACLSCSSGGGAAERSAFVSATVGPDGALTVDGRAFRATGAVLRLLDDGASVTLASEAEAKDHLRPGMVVVVKGRLAPDGRSGTADEILYRAVLRGPLAGRGESLLAVGAADVAIDAATVVLDASGARTAYDALPAGGRVEVSGWPETGTRVRATLVRALPGEPALALRGWSLAAPVDGRFAFSFLQGGAQAVVVDAGAAAAPVPANALVRVGGGSIAAGVLDATSVRVEAQLLPLPEDRAVVDGVVTEGDLASFAVGEHRVRTTAATAYDGVPSGSTAAAGFARGVRLVAEGSFDGQDVVAERVRFVGVDRRAGRIVPGSFAIANPATSASFEVGGAVVVVDGGTRLADRDGAPLTIRQLAELHAAQPEGLPVAIHGDARADGAMQAHRVDVTDGA
jgi:hypothetical protein